MVIDGSMKFDLAHQFCSKRLHQPRAEGQIMSKSHQETHLKPCRHTYIYSNMIALSLLIVSFLSQLDVQSMQRILSTMEAGMLVI